MAPDRSALVATLQQDVRGLIEPHTQATKRPPFSALECIAIVMALGSGLTDGMTELQILSSITSRFAYYSTRAAQEQATAFIDARDGAQPYSNHGPEEIVEGFSRAMTSFDLPVSFKHAANGQADRRSRVYLMDTPEVRFALRTHLETPRTGTFPFLELPPELRSKIYGYMLIFTSKSGGLTFDHDHRVYRTRYSAKRAPRSLERINRAPVGADTPTWSEWDPGDDGPQPLKDVVALPASQEIFAIAYTCKQLHGEAMSAFYGGNSFSFYNVKRLEEWAKTVSYPAGKKLGTLNIRLGRAFYPQDKNALAVATRALASVKQLDQCNIDVCFAKAAQWKQAEYPTYVDGAYVTSYYTSWNHVPGMGGLALLACKAEKLQLLYQLDKRLVDEDEIQAFRTWIVQESERIRPIVAAGHSVTFILGPRRNLVGEPS